MMILWLWHISLRLETSSSFSLLSARTHLPEARVGPERRYLSRNPSWDVDEVSLSGAGSAKQAKKKTAKKKLRNREIPIQTR